MFVLYEFLIVNLLVNIVFRVGLWNILYNFLTIKLFYFSFTLKENECRKKSHRKKSHGKKVTDLGRKKSHRKKSHKKELCFFSHFG